MFQIRRIINSFFHSNSFLLYEEAGMNYWLVDIGDIEQVAALLPDGAVVQGLFITHTHYDHIYGINKLLEQFPNLIVYTSEQGKAGLYSDKLNFSRYHDDSLIYQGEDVRVLHEGDRVELWPDCFLEVMETPGHDRSCLTYKVGDAVFCGDSYLPDTGVFIKFPGSDKVQAAESEKRIQALAADCTICPGHGEMVFRNGF